MGILSALEPKRVFYYFEILCGIPHSSYHTKEISDYCVSVAENLHLNVRQDRWNNVTIWKPASAGCEHAPTIMLQGHLDMVCEQEHGNRHDFEREGLRLLLQDDYVTADGTTLGGDDGIAVAICLAILEDPALVHPPLEVVFTTEEEVGMDGAIHLQTDDLLAEVLLNLDSEEEGVLTVSSAGGSTSELHLPYQSDIRQGIPYEIRISGLCGGHSGVEIHKGRANSNHLMGTVLAALSETIPFELISVDGGLKQNAIPRETVAQILLDSEKRISAVQSVLEKYRLLFCEAYRDTEAELRLELKPLTDVADRESGLFSRAALPRQTAGQLIRLLTLMPDGVQSMSQKISGLPETSLNLGVLRTESQEIVIEVSSRSSNQAALELQEDAIRYIALLCGFSCQKLSEYPAWRYRTDSPLQDTMQRVYRRLYQKDMKVEAVHAGLECGIFASKLPRLDIVSFGPDILDIHTPQERLSVSSVKRTYEYLLAVLEALSAQPDGESETRRS